MSRKIGVSAFYELSFEGKPALELKFRFVSASKWVTEEEQFGGDSYYYLDDAVEEKLGETVHGVMEKGLEQATNKLALLKGLLENYENLQAAMEDFEKSYKSELLLVTIDFRFNGLYENQEIVGNPEWKMLYFPGEVFYEEMSDAFRLL